MPAVDHDYESLRLSWRRDTIFDWGRRVWRTVYLSPLRWGCVDPVDPDALIDAYAAEFRPTSRDMSAPPVVYQMEGALRLHGPQTAPQLAALLDRNRTRVHEYLARFDRTFAVVYVGSGKEYWGLVGEHEGWQPTPDDGDQRALALLAEHGELSSRQLEEFGIHWRALKRLHEQGRIERRSFSRHGHIAHYWRVKEGA